MPVDALECRPGSQTDFGEIARNVGSEKLSLQLLTSRLGFDSEMNAVCGFVLVAGGYSRSVPDRRVPDQIAVPVDELGKVPARFADFRTFDVESIERPIGREGLLRANRFVGTRQHQHWLPVGV